CGLDQVAGDQRLGAAPEVDVPGAQLVPTLRREQLVEAERLRLGDPPGRERFAADPVAEAFLPLDDQHARAALGHGARERGGAETSAHGDDVVACSRRRRLVPRAPRSGLRGGYLRLAGRLAGAALGQELRLERLGREAEVQATLLEPGVASGDHVRRHGVLASVVVAPQVAEEAVDAPAGVPAEEI